MNPKVSIWKMDLISIDKDDKEVLKSDESFIFPCSDKCLVAACCNLYCALVFQYMNRIANCMCVMTADEIEIYRKTTPNVIKRKIQEFYTFDKRLAYPENCTVSRDWK